MQDGAKFCASCGNNAGEPKSQVRQLFQQDGQSQGNPGEHRTQANFQNTDNNKLMGILSYIGILVLIPLFSEKENSFVRYHINQGLVLAVIEVGYIILISILNAILWAISWHVAMVFSTIFWLLSLAFVALAIIGIMNVVNGKMKPLPIIGGLTLLK